jgi:hypothetical protein
MPILTLLISLFFTVANFNGETAKLPENQITKTEKPSNDNPEFIIMDEDTP